MEVCPCNESTLIGQKHICLGLDEDRVGQDQQSCSLSVKGQEAVLRAHHWV